MRVVARCLLERINGVLRILGNRPIGLQNTYEKSTPAGVTGHVLLEATAIMGRATVTATLSGGTPAVPKGQRYLTAALTDHTLAEALSRFGQASDWPDLYNVWEVIEEQWGGRIVANGWANKTELRDFTETAQLDRHARPPGAPPPGERMTYRDGHRLIRRLLASWSETV